MIVLITTFVSTASFGQLFSTGMTLESGAISIGINPALYPEGNSNTAFFFHGGYGLGGGSDIGMKLGFGNGSTYFGLDFEKMVYAGKPYVSLAIGGHVQNHFGLDGRALITFPIKALYLTSGIDMDLNFVTWDTDGDGNDELDMQMPVWLPIGFEYYIKKQFSIVFEAEIPLSNATTYVGGGISVYF